MASGSAWWPFTRPTLQFASNGQGSSVSTLILQDRIGRSPVHLSDSALTRPYTEGLTGGFSKSPEWQSPTPPTPSMERDLNRNFFFLPNRMAWRILVP